MQKKTNESDSKNKIFSKKTVRFMLLSCIFSLMLTLLVTVKYDLNWLGSVLLFTSFEGLFYFTKSIFKKTSILPKR